MTSHYTKLLLYCKICFHLIINKNIFIKRQSKKKTSKWNSSLFLIMSAFWETTRNPKTLCSVELSLYKKRLEQLSFDHSGTRSCWSWWQAAPLWEEIADWTCWSTGPLRQTQVCSFSRTLNLFLPPHFGLFDGSEVRVVNHVVLAALRRGNHPVGRKHGVLFVSMRIVLVRRQKVQVPH